MKERFLVIGSNSFSGAHFVRELLEHSYDVLGVSRSPELHAVFLPYSAHPKKNLFSFQQVDLNNDLPRLLMLIDEFRPTHVVNFAAQAMVAESWTCPEHWFTTNVVANVKLHDALRQRSFLQKYVHISTPEVYGHCPSAIKEEHSFNPTTPYAVSRAACDMSLVSFLKQYQFPVVFTRAANVFGPHQQLYRIIPRAILYGLTGKKLKLDGGGTSVRSFIHIKDVCRGTLAAALKGTPGDVYHFSTTRYVEIRELAAMIAGELGMTLQDLAEIGPERPGKDGAYLLNCENAVNRLGFQPQLSLEQGVAETIAWVKENLRALEQQPHAYQHKP